MTAELARGTAFECLFKVEHEPGESQLADTGTKAVPTAKLQERVAFWNLKCTPGQKVAALLCRSRVLRHSAFERLSTKLALLVQCLCGFAENAGPNDVTEHLSIQYLSSIIKL